MISFFLNKIYNEAGNIIDILAFHLSHYMTHTDSKP